MTLSDASGNAGIRLRSDHASGVAGEISVFNDSGFETVEILAAEAATDNGGQVMIRKADGTTTIQLDGEYGSGGGYVSVAGGSADPAIRADGSGMGKNDATLRVNNSQPNQGMAAYLTNSSTFATMHVQNDGTGETLWLENNGGGHLIVARDATQWQFWVDGDGVTNTRVVRIHGGADLSEGFDIRGPHAETAEAATSNDAVPLPGMVVSIDPKRPGKLVVAHEAYDRKVAGIISGAGGVSPGMVMGQHGSTADGAFPVALTGRVYCLCDTSGGAIEPGDLLTTSDTPGHAMKVTTHSRATGAILGKAMTGLARGEKGLVLVLVRLQ